MLSCGPKLAFPKCFLVRLDALPIDLSALVWAEPGFGGKTSYDLVLPMLMTS